MLTQHTVTHSSGQLGRAVLKQSQGFLDASFFSHKSILSQSCLQFSTQPSLRASAAKLFAMESIGELAKVFRLKRGWSYTRMAQEVSRYADSPVSRQAITQLEDVGTRKPHYIAALAKVMGTTADLLLSGMATTEATPDKAVEISASTAVQGLSAALKIMSPARRDQAASLLQSLARDPDGPWAAWLVELVKAAPAKTEVPAIYATAKPAVTVQTLKELNQLGSPLVHTIKPTAYKKGAK